MFVCEMNYKSYEACKKRYEVKKIGGKQPKRVDIDAWSYLSMHSLRGLGI